MGALLVISFAAVLITSVLGWMRIREWRTRRENVRVLNEMPFGTLFRMASIRGNPIAYPPKRYIYKFIKAGKDGWWVRRLRPRPPGVRSRDKGYQMEEDELTLIQTKDLEDHLIDIRSRPGKPTSHSIEKELVHEYESAMKEMIREKV